MVATRPTIPGLTKAKLTMSVWDVAVDARCRDPKKLAVVTVLISNKGGQLPMWAGWVRIVPDGGTTLKSPELLLQSLAANQKMTRPLDLGTTTKASGLDGTRYFKVILKPKVESGQLAFDNPSEEEHT